MVTTTSWLKFNTTFIVPCDAHLLLSRLEFQHFNTSGRRWAEWSHLDLSPSLYHVPRFSISLRHKGLRSWINQRQGEARPLKVHAEAALMVVVTSTRTSCLTDSLQFWRHLTERQIRVKKFGKHFTTRPAVFTGCHDPKSVFYWVFHQENPSV